MYSFMKNRLSSNAKPYSGKIRRRFLTLLLVCIMIFSLSACGGEKTGGSEGIKPVMVEREPEPQAVRTGNEAVSLALRQYIYARLQTERFAAAAASSAPMEELAAMVDELLLTWEMAALVSSSSVEISDQAIAALDSPAMKLTLAVGPPQAPFMALSTKPVSFLLAVYAAAGIKEFDKQTWAENLTKQYDALKGAKRYQQLARQLGTDAKTAYEQMALAQKILRNAAALEEAEGEVDAYTETLNILKTYKTASKVGLLGLSAVATGGGSVTLLEGAGFIASGVDCIVDVADTGSTIILGEGNQVAVAFGDIKDKLGPVSSLIGLANLDPGNLVNKTKDTADTLVYISDALLDWYYEGKVVGVQVFADKDGGAKLTAQIFESVGEAALKNALEAAGFVFPKTAKTLSEILGDWKPDMEVTAARLDALVSQIAEIERAAANSEGTGDAKASGQGEITSPSQTPEASSPTNKAPQYAWVLVETITNDGKSDVDHTNNGGVYQASASASPGSYSYSHKYIGETDTYPDPDQINGEGYAMKLDISIPPSVIQGGETVSLSFNLAFTSQNVSYFDGSGGCRADLGPTHFVNKDGKSFFEIYCSVKYSEKNVLLVSDTITAAAPVGGSEGERMEIWTGGPSGKLGSTYVYEWKAQ